MPAKLVTTPFTTFLIINMGHVYDGIESIVNRNTENSNVLFYLNQIFTNFSFIIK